MTRAVLRNIARGLVGVLLFAQMAVASYACPDVAAALATAQQTAAAIQSQTDASAAPLAASTERTGECVTMAGTMDPQSPNLCAEHCRYGEQSDRLPSFTLPAATLTALYVTPLLPEVAAPLRLAAASMSALVAACPPHAILHCVYRI